MQKTGKLVTVINKIIGYNIIMKNKINKKDLIIYLVIALWLGGIIWGIAYSS
jgi:hypothetical protein